MNIRSTQFRRLLALCLLEPQVKSHIQGNLNVGNDRAVLLDLITQLLPWVGYPRTLNAMNWLPVPVLPKKLWPGFRFGEKRAVTLVEHQQIVARGTNPERRDFYQLAWHLGASQSDIAFLDDSNIDWQKRVISYRLS